MTSLVSFVHDSKIQPGILPSLLNRWILMYRFTNGSLGSMPRNSKPAEHAQVIFVGDAVLSIHAIIDGYLFFQLKKL